MRAPEVKKLLVDTFRAGYEDPDPNQPRRNIKPFPERVEKGDAPGTIAMEIQYEDSTLDSRVTVRYDAMLIFMGISGYNDETGITYIAEDDYRKLSNLFRYRRVEDAEYPGLSLYFSKVLPVTKDIDQQGFDPWTVEAPFRWVERRDAQTEDSTGG